MLSCQDVLSCDICGGQLDDLAHSFMKCRRVAKAWECLVHAAFRLIGGPIQDSDLLFLKFPIMASEIHVTYAVLAFAEYVWATRGGQAAIGPQAFKERLNGTRPPFKSIFRL